MVNQFRKLRDDKVPHQNIFCQWKNSFRKKFQSAKMTHFHPRMTTNDAQTLVTNQFDLVTFSQLCDLDHRKPRRFYIRCSYLHAARSIKKMRTWQPNKKGSGGVMKETPSCDRFLVFSVPGTPHVMLVFTQNPYDTKILLRFSNDIRPGDAIYLPNPDVRSFIGDNLVVTMSNPLIAMAIANAYPIVMPPTNMEKAQYVSFNFVSKSIQLAAVVPTDGVCNGTFCDSQNERDSCACIVADSRRHWALKLTFVCDEFDEMAKGNVVLSSKASTNLFVVPAVTNLPLSDPLIDSTAMGDAVRNHKYSIFVQSG